MEYLPAEADHAQAVGAGVEAARCFLPLPSYPRRTWTTRGTRPRSRPASEPRPCGCRCRRAGGGCRRVQDRLCARRRCVSRPVHGRSVRLMSCSRSPFATPTSTPTSIRPAPPDRREAGSDVMPRGRAFARSSSSISNTRSTTAICRACSAWWPMCWMRISGTSAPSDAGAVNLARHHHSTSAPIRCSSRYSAVGRDDMLSGARLAVSGSRLRSAHRLSCDQQHPAAVQSGRNAQEASARACPMPAAPTASKAGRTSTSRRWPRRSARAAGASTVSPRCCEYCEEDVAQVGGIAARADSPATAGTRPSIPQLVMHWSNYSAKTVARIQARGMPIDMPLWNLVQENKAAVIAALIRRFDPSQGSEYPIYSPDGEWSNERFAHWLVTAGISEWPRLDSGALELDGDAFRLMYGVHPAIEGLHALRDASASSCAREFRSARTAAIGRACFRLAPRPAAMRRPRACSMRTRACARSCAFRRTRSGFISTGERKRSGLRRRAAAMRRWRRPICRATSITRSHCCAGSPTTPTSSAGRPSTPTNANR